MPLTISLSLFWLIIVYFSIHLPFVALLPFSHKFKDMSPSITPPSVYSSYKSSLVQQTSPSPMCLGQESALGTFISYAIPLSISAPEYPSLRNKENEIIRRVQWAYATSFSLNLLALSTHISTKPALPAHLWLSHFWANIYATRQSCQTTAYVLRRGIA